jgi:hypothetical protein
MGKRRAGSGKGGTMDVDPGANAGYMIAAYIVTAVILVGYALVLWRRYNRAKRE